MTTQKCSEGNTRLLSKKGRLFCYTAFADEPPAIDADYHCYGRETCPTTGRLHWQGFVYFRNQKTFNAVRKLLKPHHVEKCVGSLEDNERYCAKSGDYTEIGTRPMQGARTDLVKLGKRIAQGTTVETIALENPVAYHQYGRTMEYLEGVRLSKLRRTEMPECIWLWGPTGVGKSHEANMSDDAEHIYKFVSGDHGWWDGYCGQRTVIFDDFRGEIPYGRLLTLCDKWPTNVPRRGRAPYPFMATKIYVTACGPPEDIYHNLAATDSLDQIRRRFTIRDVRGPL